jgi:hypothetical protein
MSRKTITVTDDVYERLGALKQDDESWSDIGDRAAGALESQDDDVNTDPNSVAVTNVDEIARASADAVEDRMTRR